MKKYFNDYDRELNHVIVFFICPSFYIIQRCPDIHKSCGSLGDIFGSGNEKEITSLTCSGAATISQDIMVKEDSLSPT